MSITGVRIKDLSVFSGLFKLSFGNGKGVNILIGENGTGKTTLLKCLHLNSVVHMEGSSDNVARIVNTPMDEFHETPNLPKAVIFVLGNSDYKDSVYIPEKDLLSNAKGLPESAMFGKAQFSMYEIGVILKARVLANAPEQPLYRRICEIIGGEPQHDGQSFYMKRQNVDEPIDFFHEASGFRKLALLALLIRNEQIKSGTVLLWDEPENSLNPELLPKLVEILLELAQNGVQIFIATHDYNLVRHFDVRKNKGIPVLYHNLTKQAGNGQITCKSYAKYTEMSDNLLERANENLFEAVVLDVMGDENDE